VIVYNKFKTLEKLLKREIGLKFLKEEVLLLFEKGHNENNNNNNNNNYNNNNNNTPLIVCDEFLETASMWFIILIV